MAANSPAPIDPEEVERVIAVPWRVVGNSVHADFLTRDMVTGGQFVARVIDVAEELNHHPDIDLRYATIHFELSTHSVGTLTALDVELAGQISAIATELGADPA
ncbi:4a-hydroxytetrahydrobiopterin dehydratase [Gordonia sp. CPCC 205333]|uniref:4a-hydroxytetrahydrobiopterin dehydratase n=1 Tax=Gordonia sp. CPCC 205333 TaxID=3140790 RepID=UPI003AF37F86